MTRGTNVIATTILEDTGHLFPQHNRTESRNNHEPSQLKFSNACKSTPW